jgi:predicted ester cyclase
MTMIHTGTFVGVTPTNKHVNVHGISIQQFVDGQIVAGWDNWDQLALLVQIGAVAEPKLV